MNKSYTKIYTSLKISLKKSKERMKKISGLSKLERLEMEAKMLDAYFVNIKDYKRSKGL